MATYEELKHCIFCRYWKGIRAQIPYSPYYWHDEIRIGDCSKRGLKRLYSFSTCDDFELFDDELLD